MARIFQNSSRLKPMMAAGRSIPGRLPICLGGAPVKRWHMVAILALIGALAITLLVPTMPVEERLVRNQMGESLPGEAVEALQDESIDVQLVMLDYSDNPLLLLKARAALLVYPRLAREIIPIYGHEPEFKAILAEYGEQVLLPIRYFLHNRVWSVEFLHFATTTYGQGEEAISSAFAGDDQNEFPESALGEVKDAGASAAAGEISDIQRGWYAVNFIAAEGHDFLGQFVPDESGNPRWVQTERFLEVVSSFFVGGIRDLEAKWQADEATSGADYFWAGLDVIIIGSSVKAAKAALGGKVALRGGRAALKGSSNTARLGKFRAVLSNTWKYGKYPAAVAVGIYVANNPAIIHDAFAALAHLAGLPPWLVQLAGWAIILMPLIALLAWILKWLIRPTIAFLAWSATTLTPIIEERTDKRVSEQGSD